MAKPYGLANQKLCYISIFKSCRKSQRMFLGMVGECEPWFALMTRLNVCVWWGGGAPNFSTKES